MQNSTMNDVPQVRTIKDLQHNPQALKSVSDEILNFSNISHLDTGNVRGDHVLIACYCSNQ